VTPEDFFAQTEWDEQWAKRQGWWAKRQGWQNRLRDLAKAGALIAAEIDRLQREETDDDQ
ncbi:MAG: hypothetical protein LBV79_12520, partial [Candidatus Adiutrix sp.]|nr:hypothetical protein [Candidatus Adiutrix sp.]